MAARAVFVGTARALEAAQRGNATANICVENNGDIVDWANVSFANVTADTLVLVERPRDGAEARLILAKAAEAGLKVSLFEDGAVRRLRLDDLIGRPLDNLDDEHLLSLIRGRRILITGGGGSIGAALARRVAGLQPARLTVLDSSELNLFNIIAELPDAFPILADVRDETTMRRWLARERPDLVFHAAALKQVPLVEQFPSEGVLTNISGMRHVIDAALAVGADVVFVSTDKAVDPSGVMGATKRMGELYCQALDRRGPQRVIPVRLGNVLGSSGSVVPTFEAQLAAGGPLTITDPKMTRFFVTIPQAAESLLRAAASAISAPIPGAAYTIDMGEALPVEELAREIIRLEGLRPGTDISLVFTGLRPGEKLHESLIASDEARAPDPAPGVIAALSAPRDLPELRDAMDRLHSLAREGAGRDIRDELFRTIAPPHEGATPVRALAS